MEEIKFFYDHFTDEDICGLFSVGHIIYVIVFFALAFAAIWFSRKFDLLTVKKIHKWAAITITVLEVIKISLRVIKNQWYDSWVPLYYCSLFIFAIWLSLSKNEFIKNIGFSYITMGGILAAFLFTLYPSTSLAIFPIWHPAAIHSLVFHFTMLYVGSVFLISGYYKPQKEHSLNYFILITLACIPAYILNSTLGTNCMFLRDCFGLPFLQWIIDLSPLLYALLAYIAQAIPMYWFNYMIYKIASKNRKGV